MKKYFPIKTSTACQLKWTWSSLYLYNGETNSCHRVQRSAIPENFDFHNTPKKIQDRQLMLQGLWPQGGCEHCQQVEAAGGRSDRQFQTEIPDLYPPELDIDTTAVHVTPRLVEVYLDNVCNMSCIYCEDKFSSRIHAENEKFGRFEYKNLVIDNISKRAENFDELQEKFWRWLDANYHEVYRLQVLGGEPFFQSQFETFMEFLESHANPKLEFNIVSNLKVSKDRLESTINRIKNLIRDKKIKRFDLTCSIDCWGAEQEYIRHGIDMEFWRKNFEYVCSQKWIKVNINQTITNLGMKSMPDLIEYVNEIRKTRDVEHYFQKVYRNPHMYPEIFGPEFFNSDFEKILAAMPDSTWQQKSAKDMMRGVQLEIQRHNKNNAEIENLYIFLEENDRRRGTNWKKTFPWLIEEFKKCGIAV